MNREDFEKLLSDALDEPAREDLRKAIDAAALANPSLRSTRDEWSKLDRLTRRATTLAGVNWPRFRAHVVQAIVSDGLDAGAPLDLARRISEVDGRVDWARLKQRVVHAALGERQPRVIRFPYRGIAAIGLLAAAAAVALFVLRGPGPTPAPLPAPAGFARVSVTLVAERAPDRGKAFARVQLSPLAPSEVAPLNKPAPELSLTIDPAPPGGGVIVN